MNKFTIMNRQRNKECPNVIKKQQLVYVSK